MKKSLLLLIVIVALGMLAVQCGAAPTPQVVEKPVVVEKKVVETVVVEKPVEVEKEVVKTVVVEKVVEPPKLKVGQVTDMGGIDDKSFNATAWKGIQDAMANLGVEGKYLESQQQADYAKNIQQFLGEKLDLIVTVGFLLGVDTAKAAIDNPDRKFAIVDYAYPDCWPGAVPGKDCGTDQALTNVLGLTFATDEAAFLAGYLSAGMTKTGKVGTFGGIKIPPVTIFMKGYEAGVKYYNMKHGTSVEVLGWETAKDEGLFTGNFESTDDGRRFAESLMDEGADIILPVAGPVGLGSAAACKERGTMLIGVDTDWYVSAPEFKEVYLTSILKNMDVAVYDAIEAVKGGTFKGGMYLGTLRNDGVGIAPFHEFEGKVPAELKVEIQQARRDLIAGRLTVDGVLEGKGAAAPTLDAISQVEFTGPVQIVFWHTKTRSQEELLVEIVNDFNTTNPWGITVVPEQVESYDTIFKKTMAAIAAGNPPDLMVAYPSMVAEYQAAEVPLALDEYIASEKYGLTDAEFADIFPAYIEDNTYPVFANQILSWPFHKSMVVMFANMTLLKNAGVDKAPETWDEFYQACKAVIEKTEATNCWSIHIEASDVDAFMASVGVYPQADPATLTSRLNDPRMVEFFTLLQNMVKEGLARPEAERYSGDDEMVAMDAVFTTGSSSGLPFFPKKEDGTYAIEWAAVPLPHAPDVAPVSMLYGANIAATRSGDPQRDLAKWLFMKYWSSPEVVDKWINGTDKIPGSGYMPLQRSALKMGRTQEHLAQDEHYAQAVAQIGLGKIEPQLAGQQAVRDILEDAYLRIINGEDVKTVLDEAKAQADEQFQLKGY